MWLGVGGTLTGFLTLRYTMLVSMLLSPLRLEGLSMPLRTKYQLQVYLIWMPIIDTGIGKLFVNYCFWVRLRFLDDLGL